MLCFAYAAVLVTSYRNQALQLSIPGMYGMGRGHDPGLILRGHVVPRSEVGTGNNKVSH